MRDRGVDDPLAFSDEELMHFFDGELEPARDSELEELLADAGDARDKLAGLALVGDLLRERADADDRADGIADKVMATIDGPMGQLPTLEAPSAHGHSPGAHPANDNARTIYALAFMAAAVAAGFFVWGRGDQTRELAELVPPLPAMVESARPEVAPAPGTAEAQPEAVALAEDDGERAGVEVAAVDFGAHIGSVFFVAGADERAAQTAVVWVTDDDKSNGDEL